MPTALLDTVADPEIKAHLFAYFKLIQSVLGKRPGTPEQKKETYHKLQKQLVERAHSVDDLIDQIPDMASAMGVPAQNLSSFISQNFFKALELARKELQESSETGSSGSESAPSTDPDRDHDLIGEILESFGPVVQAPNKFVPAEMGSMKMMTPNGERLPVSLAGANPEQEAEENDASPVDGDNAKTASASNASAVPSGSEPAKKVTNKAVFSAEKEEPLIQEILNKFGNHLDVHEKLEPAAFPKNFQASSPDDAPATTENGSAAAESSSPGTGSGGVKTNAVPQSSGPTIQWPEEDETLIQEILNQFGNVLAVHGKLEPSDGFPPRSGQPTAAATSGPGASEAASEDSSASATSGSPGPNSPINFARYTEIRAQLAKFQKAGDQQGYKQFLQELSQDEKLVVPLRNLENKLQKNPSLRVQDEVYNLAMQLSTSPEKLAAFREAMVRFDRIQLLLNDFVQRVKKGPAPLMKAVQSIWSQVRLLLNQVDQLESMRSQMKFLLLGIQDPEVKKKTQEILESLLNRANSIYIE